MRLWHWKLIPVLPRQQLLGQWMELCLIAKNISEKGTPNHILVNEIMNYPLDHLVQYQYIVWKEMKNRGYNPDDQKFFQWIPNRPYAYISQDRLFKDWHNDRYFNQCVMNLEEKFDRGGIPLDEWKTFTEWAYFYLDQDEIETIRKED